MKKYYVEITETLHYIDTEFSIYKTEKVKNEIER